MKRSVRELVKLNITAQRTLFLDMCERPHIEACGVLLGAMDEQGNWYVEQAYPLPNIFHSPVYFEFAPEDLLKVELAYPERIIGVYHSHPTGYASASNTDRENMKRVNQEQNIPWIWFIICGPFDATFVSRAGGTIPQEALLAYHHYPHKGLRHVPVHFERKRIADEEEREDQEDQGMRG